MEKTNYHHGALREEMIKKGLLLINNEGVKNFSLRKVAAMCQVSHAAPYKHFKNKEELMEVISNRVLQSFSQCLSEAVKAKRNEQVDMTHIGKAYVTFFVQNKEFFKFIFFSECGVKVRLQEECFIYDEGNPFEIFCRAATTYLKGFTEDKDKINHTILNMWSIVHGITTLIISGTFEYEGDYDVLIENMLKQNI